MYSANYNLWHSAFCQFFQCLNWLLLKKQCCGYPRIKSLEGQSALKAMFDFIGTEMDLQFEICLRFELEKRYWTKN